MKGNLQMDNAKEAISEEIQDLIKQINMNISHVISGVIKDSPLTAHQMFIMKTIRKNSNANLTSLCREVNLSKGSLSLMINKLSEEGYVSRNGNSLDRRNSQIILTKKGEEILNNTIKESRIIFDQLTSALSEGELADIKINLKI
jgi:DNA-binding MarR family transcriptional regulator